MDMDPTRDRYRSRGVSFRHSFLTGIPSATLHASRARLLGLFLIQNAIPHGLRIPSAVTECILLLSLYMSELSFRTSSRPI
jgi:hypothetical protein